MDGKPTGNPVFDYKAGFRAKAAALQRMLLLLGLAALVAGAVLRCFTFTLVLANQLARWLPLAGVLLIAESGVWGFLWRSKLRDNFRRDCN